MEDISKWEFFMSMIVQPLNPMPDGTCRTIKRQYQQSSLANFIRGGAYGATGVIVYETDNGNTEIGCDD